MSRFTSIVSAMIMIAKFWIDPIRLQESGGFNRSELAKIQKIIQENQGKFMEAWNEFFSE